MQALENGALLVVDEIEDSLHPLLTRRLIEMVQDKAVNTKGAQLIFTTHDAMLLDLNFFRRDQIWFAEKNDETCATEFYSLASFSQEKEKMCVRVIFRDDLVQSLLSEVTPDEQDAKRV